MGVWIETRSTAICYRASTVTPFVGVWIETLMKETAYWEIPVTPFVGVWIETPQKSGLRLLWESHPSWVCGLKLARTWGCADVQRCHTLRGCVDWNATKIVDMSKTKGHTLRGCVDWNKRDWYMFRTNQKSHPSWVCGLKLRQRLRRAAYRVSHPSWVCGLKHSRRGVASSLCGHTLRGCVDWNFIFFHSLSL